VQRSSKRKLRAFAAERQWALLSFFTWRGDGALPCRATREKFEDIAMQPMDVLEKFVSGARSWRFCCVRRVDGTAALEGVAVWPPLQASAARGIR